MAAPDGPRTKLILNEIDIRRAIMSRLGALGENRVKSPTILEENLNTPATHWSPDVSPFRLHGILPVYRKRASFMIVQPLFLSRQNGFPAQCRAITAAMPDLALQTPLSFKIPKAIKHDAVALPLPPARSKPPASPKQTQRRAYDPPLFPSRNDSDLGTGHQVPHLV